MTHLQLIILTGASKTIVILIFDLIGFHPVINSIQGHIDLFVFFLIAMILTYEYGA